MKAFISLTFYVFGLISCCLTLTLPGNDWKEIRSTSCAQKSQNEDNLRNISGTGILITMRLSPCLQTEDNGNCVVSKSAGNVSIFTQFIPRKYILCFSVHGIKVNRYLRNLHVRLFPIPLCCSYSWMDVSCSTFHFHFHSALPLPLCTKQHLSLRSPPTKSKKP